MGSIKTVRLPTLGGSIRQGVSPSIIGDTEWADIRNLYQYEGKLRRRPIPSTIASGGAAITGLFALHDSTGAGSWRLVVGQPLGLSYVSGTSIISIPITDGRTYSSSNNLWSFLQYNNIIIAARKSIGAIKRSDGQSFVMDAGIIAPISAPTLATGAAGAILAGNYYGVFTYYNANTGAESDLSLISSLYAAPGAAKIDWSGIVASPNGQVTHKRLYRTLRNQTGAYYLVDTIDNSQTTYTGDNLTTDLMGDPVSLTNGLPPANISIVVLWKDRNFCTDGVDVFFSNFQLMEAFDPNSLIKVNSDDGQQVRGLAAWGDRLFVGKTGSIWLINSPDGFTFKVVPMSSRHGCYSHHSIKEIEGSLFWYGGDDVYASSGGEPKAIGDSKIRTILDAIPDAQKEQVVAGVVPSLGWYCLSVPQSGLYTSDPVSFPASTRNRYLLVYNYRADVWTVFDYPNTLSTPPGQAVDPSPNYVPFVGPSFLTDFFDANYKRLLYGSIRDGKIDDMLAATVNPTWQYLPSSGGTQCICALTSKAFAMEDPAHLHTIRHLILDCTSLPTESLTISLIRDIASAYGSRVVNLNGAGFKPMRLSSQGAPSYLTQFVLSYSGYADIELSQIVFDMCASSGRHRFSR